MKAVFFDVGGVFRDSREAMHDGLAKAFAESGREFPFTPTEVWHLRGIHSINPRTNFVQFSLSFDSSAEEVLSLSYREANALCSAYVREISEEARELAKASEAYFYKAERVRSMFLEETSSLIESLKPHLKFGIVTNSRESSLKRDVPSLLPYMDVVVAKDHIKNKKPHPEPLLKACSLAGVEPSEACYIADSIHDLYAARAAGLRFYGVATGMSFRRWLEEEGAEVKENVISAIEAISKSL